MTLVIGYRSPGEIHILGDRAVMFESGSEGGSPVPKVLRCGQVLVGLAGELIGNFKMQRLLGDKEFDTALELCAAWRPPKDCAALILGPDHTLVYTRDDAPSIPPEFLWKVDAQITAIGCGGDFALGYMVGHRASSASPKDFLGSAANATHEFLPHQVRGPWDLLSTGTK